MVDLMSSQSNGYLYLRRFKRGNGFNITKFGSKISAGYSPFFFEGLNYSLLTTQNFLFGYTEFLTIDFFQQEIFNHKILKCVNSTKIPTYPSNPLEKWLLSFYIFYMINPTVNKIRTNVNFQR